jgi:hypothetical protein
MDPVIAAQAIVVLMCLAIMAFVAHLLEWVADTVLPDMWEVGKQFGHPPTSGEQVLQKVAKRSSYLLRFTLVALVVSAFF